MKLLSGVRWDIFGETLYIVLYLFRECFRCHVLARWLHYHLQSVVVEGHCQQVWLTSTCTVHLFFDPNLPIFGFSRLAALDFHTVAVRFWHMCYNNTTHICSKTIQRKKIHKHKNLHTVKWAQWLIVCGWLHRHLYDDASCHLCLFAATEFYLSGISSGGPQLARGQSLVEWWLDIWVWHWHLVNHESRLFILCIFISCDVCVQIHTVLFVNSNGQQWLFYLVSFVCACGQNPSLDSSIASFDQFGLHKDLLSGLAQLNYHRPTTVQVQYCCELTLSRTWYSVAFCLHVWF